MEETGYALFQSSNLYVELFRETLPFIFAGVLFYLYTKGRINIIECLLYSFATEAYSVIMVGPTINATFFLGYAFLFQELHRLISGQLYIKREYFTLLILPLLSSIAVFFVVAFYNDAFFYPQGKYLSFVLKPLYFYFKTYLPLFAIGSKIVRDREQLSWDNFFATVQKIAKISCFIALLQIIVEYTFNSNEMGEIIGLQRRYLEQQSGTAFPLRVQAFFGEPKIFAAFLSLAIPVFMKDRRYLWAIVCFIMGVLTLSQTFFINLLACSIVFVLLYRLWALRFKIIAALAIIVVLFMGFAAYKTVFFAYYAQNQNSLISRLLFERSVSRYDDEESNVVLGLPLQKDLELPVINFLRDNPLLIISGYGAGNSTFIPPVYFEDQQNYKNREAGIGAVNFNMRWLYLIAEFGFVAFLFFFFILTRRRVELTRFENNYVTLVWVCFFFSQIDIFLIIVALFSYYETAEIS